MKKGEIHYYTNVAIHATLNCTSVSVSEENSTFLPNPVAFCLNNRKAKYRLDFRLLSRKKMTVFSSLIPLRANIAAEHTFFPSVLQLDLFPGLDSSRDFMEA